MTSGVAIVGMACHYPDADSPAALWEAVLAGRRAFRRIPPERLRLEDYVSDDELAVDHTYLREAALLEGYEFDRAGFRVSGRSFRSADLTHWLALDTANSALSAAGFPGGRGLPRETTGVLVGNTLTGEFSRANLLRLRWPYVRRVVDQALLEQGWEPPRRRELLRNVELRYKAPFPPPDEETLVGSLSNTIAGRICNHFDLKGGGYCVDGACASSLLGVAAACSALAAGDLDVVLAGGVDLSLDPLELVGFARAGAFARDEMLVYDANSAGFWPGEGCGFVVLMRHEDAAAQACTIHALIRGWGISSDGAGGLTRPEVEGQVLALRRAYRRAGFGIETVSYFEGHGTGTAVGDLVEVSALTRARQEAGARTAAILGTVKANIGHTKAAAGIAGLIKAVMAVETGVLPPTTGCNEVHPELGSAHPPLRVLRRGELWPLDRPRRAGVSAMGFGGINSHLVVESPIVEPRAVLTDRERALIGSAQDAELFVIGGADRGELLARVKQLQEIALRLSRAELSDLSFYLYRALGDLPVRAALVAATPPELAQRLATLKTWIDDRVDARLDPQAGVFLGCGSTPPRIGFLFPGQGSPAPCDGGALSDRFEGAREPYKLLPISLDSNGTDTRVVQPAIVAASAAGLLVLGQLGIEASVGVGHSLGELTAIHWAQAIGLESVLRIATVRGRAMAELGSSTGAMASIAAGVTEVQDILTGGVVITGVNSPRQTVIGGEATAVALVMELARHRGLAAVRLPVSHAFHTPLVEAAARPLASHLATEAIGSLRHLVASSVVGRLLTSTDDLRSVLELQVTSPVRFHSAFSVVSDRVDLWIEVGPGRVLSSIVADIVTTPAISLDVGKSFRGLLHVAGAALAAGCPVDLRHLFEGRFVRPFDPASRPRFLASPCELAPVPPEPSISEPAERHVPSNIGDAGLASNGANAPRVSRPGVRHAESGDDVLALVLQLVADRTELPRASIRGDQRLLRDLHLNSIAVGQVVAEAARHIGLQPPAAPTALAGATVAEIAQFLTTRLLDPPTSGEEGELLPEGVDSWVRPFTVELVQSPLPLRPVGKGKGHWQLIAPPTHPLAGALATSFETLEGTGVIVCLPQNPDERHLPLMLGAARAVLATPGPTKLIVVQDGGGGAAFARTVHDEAPDATTCIVDISYSDPNAVSHVVQEALGAEALCEAHYDSTGRRWEPVLRLMRLDAIPETLTLGPDDVLLATGGAKGITAECVLALATTCQSRVVLLGRSRPEEDPDLASNIARMMAAGITCRYVAADVTDAAAVRRAVDNAQALFGPITAVIHGAGINRPQMLESLDEASMLKTIAPKVQGLRNVLAAVDPARLRLLCTFGSIIGRSGIRGGAAYAVANEWLSRLTADFQASWPTCQCIALEWSIWSGVGMGAREGHLDTLIGRGVSAISPDSGVALFTRMVTRTVPGSRVIVTGRCGNPPRLAFETSELPLLRFLEHPRVFYPGVELIADADLSPTQDPYLNDHVFAGERLFPGAMGLEAMAQAASAVSGSPGPFVFEEVVFARPVVVSGSAPATIRIAALVEEPDRISIRLRCCATGFKVDHFRATCRILSGASSSMPDPARQIPIPCNSPAVSLDPDRDLYGSFFFQEGRFGRLNAYHQLCATSCVAGIRADGGTRWFGRYLPDGLVLGDAGARDAALHAVQACIPHRTLLPIGVDRVRPAKLLTTDSLTVQARERARHGDEFMYDVGLIGSDGALIEFWEGLHLQMLPDSAGPTDWPPGLLGPYIERYLTETVPDLEIAVAVDAQGEAGNGDSGTRAIQRALGAAVPVYHRPDGGPEVAGPMQVSASHMGNLTLAVAGPTPLACDFERVEPRSRELWRHLLSPGRLALAEEIMKETRESLDVAATRVWCALECLTKRRLSPDVSLILVGAAGGSWVQLQSGAHTIATLITSVRGQACQLALAVLVPTTPARAAPMSSGI